MKFGGGGKRGRAIPQWRDPPTPFLFARPSVQFLSSRQRLEQSVGVLFKMSSDFFQQTPPIATFAVLGKDCLGASPLAEFTPLGAGAGISAR